MENIINNLKTGKFLLKKSTLAAVIFMVLALAQVMAQEVEMDVLKEKWQVMPLIALDLDKNPITDLKKSDLEFIINDRNIRIFRLEKIREKDLKSKNFRQLMSKSLPGRIPGTIIKGCYEIHFPYLDEYNNSIRKIAIGCYLKGATLYTPDSLVKSINKNEIAEVHREIKALNLLLVNSMLNPVLNTLNPDPKWDEQNRYYRITLPEYFLKSKLDQFLFTPSAEENKFMIESTSLLPQEQEIKIIAGKHDCVLIFNDYYRSALFLGPKPGAEVVSRAINFRKNRIKYLEKEKISFSIALIPTRDLLGRNQAEGDPLPPSKIKHTDNDPLQDKIEIDPDQFYRSAFKSRILEQLKIFKASLTSNILKSLCSDCIANLAQGRLKRGLRNLKVIGREIRTRNKILDDVYARLANLDKKTGEIIKQGKKLEKRIKKLYDLSIPRQLLAMAKKGDLQHLIKYLKQLMAFNKQRVVFVADNLKLFFRISGIRGELMGTDFALHYLIPERTRHCRRILEYLTASQEEMAKNIICERAAVSRLLAGLQKLLPDAIKEKLFYSRVFDLASQVHALTTENFVLSHSDHIPQNITSGYLSRKLKRFGLTQAQITDPQFFNVLLYAKKIRKNEQGFIEAGLFNDTVLIFIPKGSFIMGVPWESGGADDESPAHKVFLDSYWIAKFEVTYKQFDRFSEEVLSGDLPDSDFGRGNRPVINITWDQAVEYCKWMSRRSGVVFRLPSEAEWEMAARGNHNYRFPWGNSPVTGTRANFADSNLLKRFESVNPAVSSNKKAANREWADPKADDRYTFTAPVGSYRSGASPYGVMDMAGNVWEWVNDWYDGDYYRRSPANNPRGFPSGNFKSVRGGSWDCNKWMIRTTTRAGGDRTKRSNTVGFRLAAEADISRNH